MQPEQPVGDSGHHKLLMMGGGLILVVIAIVVVAIIGVTRHNKANSAAKHEAIIQITANGFVPATLKVKGDTAITWKNVDSGPHQVASNPYPADNGTPGLKSSSIPAGGSYTYDTSNKAMTIQYHDETSPTHNATIVVEP